MDVHNQHRKTREVIDEQERFLAEQVERYSRNLSLISARKRRLIVYRLVSLFSGIVLMLFGVIDLIVIRDPNAQFQNVIIFTISELLAIPLLRYSLVVFRKLSIDKDINDLAELIALTKEQLAQIRKERLIFMRGPEKERTTVAKPPLLNPDPVDAADPPSTEDSKECPDCGKTIPRKASICRSCGHLFI